MAKLTKAFLNDVQPGATRYIVWDEEVPAFGIRVSPDGSISFILMVRIRGRKVTMTLGKHGEITAAQAKERAKDWKDQVRHGIDPRAEKRAARAAMEFETGAHKFLDEHADVYLAPRTAYVYRRIVEGILIPHFKRTTLREIDLAAVSRFHTLARARGSRQANHALAILSKLLNLAEEWGERPHNSNPCRARKRYPETKRQRYLTEDELGRLGDALKAAEPVFGPYAPAALRLLVLTGARKSEVRDLQWDQVDLDAGMARIDRHKTAKTQGAKTIPLPPPAVDLLKSLETQQDNPHVFPGHHPGLACGSLDAAWIWVRKRAGIKDVHLHDLRHTFGATAAGQGSSLRVIGSILGHAAAATTQRYAHVAPSPAQEAAGKAAEAIDRALNAGG